MTDLERRARRIAARKMDLRKDPQGKRLPADLWQQALPEAERELSLLQRTDMTASDDQLRELLGLDDDDDLPGESGESIWRQHGEWRPERVNVWRFWRLQKDRRQ